MFDKNKASKRKNNLIDNIIKNQGEFQFCLAFWNIMYRRTRKWKYTISKDMILEHTLYAKNQVRFSPYLCYIRCSYLVQLSEVED